VRAKFDYGSLLKFQNFLLIFALHHRGSFRLKLSLQCIECGNLLLNAATLFVQSHMTAKFDQGVPTSDASLFKSLGRKKFGKPEQACQMGYTKWLHNIDRPELDCAFT
jgi:hypothetical protein